MTTIFYCLFYKNISHNILLQHTTHVKRFIISSCCGNSSNSLSCFPAIQSSYSNPETENNHLATEGATWQCLVTDHEMMSICFLSAPLHQVRNPDISALFSIISIVDLVSFINFGCIHSNILSWHFKHRRTASARYPLKQRLKSNVVY